MNTPKVSPVPALLRPIADRFNAPFPKSNLEFIEAVMMNFPKAAYPIVGANPSDPTANVRSAIPAYMPQPLLQDGTHNFLNCSSFYRDENGVRAADDRFASCHFLLLDDIGTKIDISLMDDIDVSWLIETCPGNYQAGLVLWEPITNLESASWIGDLLSTELSGVETVGSATRWARLPLSNHVGHIDESEQPFHCRLVKWRPEVRHCIEDLYSVICEPLLLARIAREASGSLKC
jgi:hypothetical protein